MSRSNKTCQRAHFLLDLSKDWNIGAKCWTLIRIKLGFPDPIAIEITDAALLKAYYGRGCVMCDKSPSTRKVHWQLGAKRICNSCISEHTTINSRLARSGIDSSCYSFLPKIPYHKTVGWGGIIYRIWKTSVLSTPPTDEEAVALKDRTDKKRFFLYAMESFEEENSQMRQDLRSIREQAIVEFLAREMPDLDPFELSSFRAACDLTAPFDSKSAKRLLNRIKKELVEREKEEAISHLRDIFTATIVEILSGDGYQTSEWRHLSIYQETLFTVFEEPFPSSTDLIAALKKQVDINRAAKRKEEAIKMIQKRTKSKVVLFLRSCGYVQSDINVEMESGSSCFLIRAITKEPDNVALAELQTKIRVSLEGKKQARLAYEKAKSIREFVKVRIKEFHAAISPSLPYTDEDWILHRNGEGFEEMPTDIELEELYEKIQRLAAQRHRKRLADELSSTFRTEADAKIKARLTESNFPDLFYPSPTLKAAITDTQVETIVEKAILAHNYFLAHTKLKTIPVFEALNISLDFLKLVDPKGTLYLTDLKAI